MHHQNQNELQFQGLDNVVRRLQLNKDLYNFTRLYHLHQNHTNRVLIRLRLTTNSSQIPHHLRVQQLKLALYGEHAFLKTLF
jgi:hypothetical protein